MRRFRKVAYDAGPLIEFLGNKQYRLARDFRAYWTDENGKDQSYLAGRGMEYDRSSIPQIFQSFTPKDGNKLKCSTIHDHQYENRPSGWTRHDMDRLLYAGMRAVGYSRLTALKHYLGVRIGGYFVWRKRSRS